MKVFGRRTEAPVLASLPQPFEAGGATAPLAPGVPLEDLRTRVMEQVDLSATGSMRGTTDTHELVQSIAQAEIALETAVAIRDKVVEAYQEILRMPV